jgi:hypothetical protein
VQRDTIDSVGFFVIPVIAELILGIQQDGQSTGYAYSKPHNIDC